MSTTTIAVTGVIVGIGGLLVLVVVLSIIKQAINCLIRSLILLAVLAILGGSAAFLLVAQH